MGRDIAGTNQVEVTVMNLIRHSAMCVRFIRETRDKEDIRQLRKQYFSTGYYGHYLSYYEFIKDHRQDLYQEYLVWLTKRKLTGDSL